MIVTNSNWDAKNASLAKRPIYVMAIGGQATVYTTCDLAAAGVTGTLPSHQPWLRTPQGASQSIDVVMGTSTIGELTCEVTDTGKAITTLVGGTTLEGATLTLSVGYPGIAWTEFVVVQSYVIYKITPASGYASWLFKARDAQLYAKKTIALHPENGGRLAPDNPWYLSGSPSEIVQAVLLFGAELGAGTVDRAAFAALDDPAEGLYAATRPFLFALTEPFGAKQFIETEVLKPSGLLLVITSTGKISVKSFRPPAAGVTSVWAFSADNMMVLPEIDRLPVVNEVVFRLDYDGDKYQSEQYFLEGTSLGTFGRATQWVCESRGLRSEQGGRWFAQWAADRMFRRFAGTPAALRGGAPTAKIEAVLMTLPVWVGDLVTVSHPKMPNLLTGSVGVTNRLYEVIGRDPDYAAGRMRYTLLDTGLTGAGAAYQWGSGSARPMIIGTSPIY